MVRRLLVVSVFAVVACRAPAPQCPKPEPVQPRRVPEALKRDPTVGDERTGWRMELTSRFPLRTSFTKDLGLPLDGELVARINLTVPESDLSKANGEVWITCRGCSLGDGLAKIPFPYPASAVTLPRIGLGKVAFQLTIKDGTVQLKDILLADGEIEAALDGVLRLRSPVEQSQIKATLRLRLTRGLTRREPKLVLLQNLLFGNEGLKLTGTLADLRARMRPGSSSQPAVRPKPQRSPGWQKHSALVRKAVKKIGPRRFILHRKPLAKLMGQTGMLIRSARIVPSFYGGKPSGFQVYAIRPGSLYAYIGFRNGDTLKAINGTAINTPAAALNAYTSLTKARKVTIDISRTGSPLTFVFLIR